MLQSTEVGLAADDADFNPAMFGGHIQNAIGTQQIQAEGRLQALRTPASKVGPITALGRRHFQFGSDLYNPVEQILPVASPDRLEGIFPP